MEKKKLEDEEKARIKARVIKYLLRRFCLMFL